MDTDTWTMNKYTDAGVVTAETPKGEIVTLVTDPDGNYIVTEHVRFCGAVAHLVAYKLGPGDVPKAEYTRFTRLDD